MRPRRHPIGLSAYLTRMLGETAGEQARTWFTRTWGAPGFATFWRYWNPVYGYALDRFVYRPLRLVLPRPVALWLTFPASGFFLHDLIGWAVSRGVHFPAMTLLFVILGTVAVAGQRLSWRDLPFVGRVVINVSWLALSFTAWQMLLRL